MANVGYATLQVIPSLKGVGESLGTQLGSAGTQAGAKGGKNAAQSFLKSFTGLAARITGAIAIGQAVKKGFDFAADAVIGFNSTLEQSRIGFTTMLGSAQKADDMLKSLQDFAKKTPFDYAQLAQYSQRLLATGINAKQIVPYMTAIGDAAAGLGTGVDGVDAISRAIGQMSSKGKVQSDELLQLTEAGVPALQILAAQYKTTTGQMQQWITEGKISAADAIPKLIAGLENGTAATAGFGGMMAKQAQTFKGAWDNIKDTATQTIAGLTLPLFNKLSAGMQKVADFMQGPGLTKGLKDIGKTLGPIAADFGKFFKGIWDASGGLDLFKDSLTVLVGGFKALGKYLGPYGEILSKYKGWIQPIAAAILTAVAAYKIWAVVTKAMAIAQGLLDLALDANPIGAIILGVLALAAGLIYAYKHSETFRNVVQAIAHFFTGPFLDALKAVGAWFSGPFVGFFKAIGDWFAGPFLSPFKAIGAWFSGPFVNFFVGCWNAIVGAVKWAIDFYIGYVTWLKNGVLAIARWFSGPFVDFFKNAWNGAVALVKAAVNWYVGYVQWLKDNVVRIVSAIVSGVTGFFTGMWNSVKSGWNAGVNALVGFANGLKDKLVNAVHSAVSAFTGIGRNIVDGLRSGIDGAWDSLVSHLKGLADKLPGAVKKVLGINSPSKVFRALGKWVPAGMALGITDGASAITRAVSQMTSVPSPKSIGSLAGAGAGAGVTFPDRLALRVGEREFDAYVDERVDSGIDANQSDLARRFGGK